MLKLGDKVGRTSELVGISSEYGRLVSYSYYEIAQRLQTGDVIGATHIATNLGNKFYIAPKDKRAEHLQILNEIIENKEK